MTKCLKHAKMLESPKGLNRLTDGHGTHVVGSMVGSVKGTQGAEESIGEFSGMAPAAKIVFFDLLAGPRGDGLNVPDALEDDYFKWAYSHGTLFVCGDPCFLVVLSTVLCRFTIIVCSRWFSLISVFCGSARSHRRLGVSSLEPIKLHHQLFCVQERAYTATAGGARAVNTHQTAPKSTVLSSTTQTAWFYLLRETAGLRKVASVPPRLVKIVWPLVHRRTTRGARSRVGGL